MERDDINVCAESSGQAIINTFGLEEEIRCAICENRMHTDRGCDGNCKYNEYTYSKIIGVLDGRIKPLAPVSPKKKGKWEYHAGQFTCNQCGKTIARIDHDGLLNFCPNCGEDMREEPETLIVDSSPYEEKLMDCERTSDMRDYNEHYGQTYSPEDGSM